MAEIHAYIAQDNPAAADRVIARILKSAALLGDFPMIGRQGRVAGTREWTISGLRYLAVYRIAENGVEVLTLVHTSRNWP